MRDGREPWHTDLLCAGYPYFILTRALIASHGQDAALATAVGHDVKRSTTRVATRTARTRRARALPMAAA